MYTGEFYDSHLGFYYNRARWYNPAVGRFNRLDPFAGANRDPQSLHKYLYAHCNPVNGLDPSGHMCVTGALLNVMNVASITATTISFVTKMVQVGMGFRQLDALAGFMIELNRAPVPDLITKLRIRNVVALVAIETVRRTVGLALQIVRDGVYLLAFSILLRGTIGFLRSMRNAARLARAARVRGPITDPARLLPSPRMHRHHIFPRQFSRFWNRAEIRANRYKVQIEQATHLRGVHGRGLAELPGRWNRAWGEFLRNNPDASALRIFQQAGRMMDEFGLSDIYMLQH